jgi:hypothetical protein
MKLTEDVRKYAAEQGIRESEGIESGKQFILPRTRPRQR